MSASLSHVNFSLNGEQGNRDGLSILLIEQNTNMALQEAHRAYLLELGRVVASGPAAQLRDDDVLRRAYLGSDS